MNVQGMRQVLRDDSGKIKLGPNYEKFYVLCGLWGPTKDVAAGEWYDHSDHAVSSSGDRGWNTQGECPLS